MPVVELYDLDAQVRLEDPKALAVMVERLFVYPRSVTFTSSFMGQLLVTQEMGGRLSAHSNGAGLGALFTLEIPIDADEEPR